MSIQGAGFNESIRPMRLTLFIRTATVLVATLSFFLPLKIRAEEEGDRIIARIGMKTVTWNDLHNEARYRRLYGALDSEMGTLLTDTLERRLLLEAWPQRRAVSPDFLAEKDERVHNSIKALETQYSSPEALDEALAASPSVREITRQTLPPDFRNRRVHRCWRIDIGTGRT